MLFLLPLLSTTLASAVEVRGMTVSTPTWGIEWGSDQMASTLDVLQSEGMNWVAYHPYAQIRNDGQVRWRAFDPEAPPEWLVRPIREAHARGMKVLVVPHLAHWGSGFDWRGAIAFPDPAQRARFFEDYERWIQAIARATASADALAVGSELDGTTMHEAEWREVITSVRTVFPGPLTYSANWDGAARVPFWDAVDAVGVQAYYPLVVDGAVTDPASLDRGWADVMIRVRALHSQTGKPIVFTELGYDAGPAAAIRPWEDGTGGPGGTDLQAACLRAALRAVEQEPAVVGAFLWKWFPGEVQGSNFRMSTPQMRAVIREAWRTP